MIKLAVCGALGRMGTLVIQEATKASDMQLVAGLDAAGQGKILPGGVTVSDPSQLNEILESMKPDVLIDFTIPEASVQNVLAAAEHKIDVVVGTTGLSQGQLSRMGAAIEDRIAAVISPNFSAGVNLFWELVTLAAETLKDYDIEVIETHHNQKRDAPSGTAIATVEAIKNVIGDVNVVFGREGTRLRGKEIGIHAIRAGDIVGDHLVLFAGPGERLEIKHQAHSRTAFASGAVRAARWVRQRKPGIYSMTDVLGSR